jgi:hypothetical protein
MRAPTPLYARQQFDRVTEALPALYRVHRADDSDTTLYPNKGLHGLNVHSLLLTFIFMFSSLDFVETASMIWKYASAVDIDMQNRHQMRDD